MREIFRLHRIWISEDLPTAAEDCQIFRKTSEDRQRFPTTSEDCQRFRKISDDFKTGPTISNEFPTNLGIIDARRCSNDFSNVKKIEFLF